MTDINEIIGRAVAEIVNLGESDHEDIGIGAAVVKALGEAGYTVMPSKLAVLIAGAAEMIAAKETPEAFLARINGK